MSVSLSVCPSGCQSRYFCLFSAALLAARDTPHVIAGCLLSQAKKERGSGANQCAFLCVSVCVSMRARVSVCVSVCQSDREKVEQLSPKLLHSVSTL